MWPFLPSAAWIFAFLEWIFSYPRVSLRAKFYSVLSVFFCRSDDITCTSDRDVTAAGGRYGETNLEEIDQLLSLNLKEKETYRI